MLLAFLSDIHFDHEDKLAWALTKRILKDLPIDRVILGGDIIDLGPLSVFRSAPQEKLALGPQIRHTRKELGLLRKAVGDIPIEFFNGNHEERLEYHIWQRTPELAALQDEDLDILTVNNLFSFEKHDIRHVRATPMKVHKLYIFHGHEIPSRATHIAKMVYSHRGGNSLAGHWHKFDSYWHKQWGNKEHGAFINACLETIPERHDVRLPDRWVGFSRWQNGITLVDFSEGGFFRVEQVLYVKEAPSRTRTHVFGKVYRAIRTAKGPEVRELPVLGN